MILAQGGQAQALAFKHRAMKVRLETLEDHASDHRRHPISDFTTSFIIACEDLESFCTLLLRIDRDASKSFFLGVTFLQISLQAFGNKETLQQHEDNLSIRRLLEPLRNLHGVGEIEITGNVSNGYKKIVQSDVTEDLQQELEVVINLPYAKNEDPRIDVQDRVIYLGYKQGPPVVRVRRIRTGRL